MKKRTLLALLFMFGILPHGFGQTDYVKTGDWCHTHSLTQEILDNDPEARLRVQALDDFITEFLTHQDPSSVQMAGATRIIPVVFHVLHTYGSENVPKSTIELAVSRMTRDHRKDNPDTTEYSAAFKGISSGHDIEFRLATIDPNGNCTDGITRTYSPLTDDGGNFNAVSQVISWDTRKYMNIYVLRDMQSGAGAYTFRPGSFSPGDRRFAIYTRFNQMGAFGGDRTLTHEIGHYLDLPHTWGNSNTPGQASNCNMDDGIGDTPNTVGTTSGCNLSQNTCNSLDNVENYMDYSNCGRMFTQGQVARMNAALNSGAGALNNLWSGSNVAATGTGDPYTKPLCKPVADFWAGQRSGCSGEAVQLNDYSWNGDPDQWTWTFIHADTTIVVSGMQHPQVELPKKGSWTVKLVAGNANGKDSLTRPDFLTLKDGFGDFKAPYKEGMESAGIPTTWETDNPAGGATWESTNLAAFSGSRSVFLNNFEKSIGNPSFLISATVDIRNMIDPRVRYKYAYAQRGNNSSDVLKVHFSKDCGRSWNVRRTRTGADLATTSNKTTKFFPKGPEDWREEEISIISFFRGIPNFLVRFEFVPGGGNNLFLDDVEIYDAATGIGTEERLIGVTRLFPNPTSGTLYLETEFDQDQVVTLEACDLTGRTLGPSRSLHITSGLQQTTLNMDDLGMSESGPGYLKISNGRSIRMLYYLRAE